MPVLLGYCDPQSVAPGETVRFMVSCEGAARYRADIVHLTSPAAGPEAPPPSRRWHLRPYPRSLEPRFDSVGPDHVPRPGRGR